jgi:hypothetical protein
MPAIDHGFKLIARLAGRELARVAGIECQEWEPVESTIQATTERLADRAFRAKRGQELFIVYMEFVTEWSDDLLWNLNAKSALIAERERQPALTVVFILRKAGYRPHNGTWRLAVGGEPTQQMWFHEIALWEIEPEPWWEQVPGLMTLYPVCKHRRPPAVAARHVLEVIRRRVPQPLQQADLLVFLTVFGAAATPPLDIMNLIGKQHMNDLMQASPFFREALQEAEMRGERKAILKVLEDRLGKASVRQVTEALSAVDDPIKLERLLQVALHCDAIDDFRKALTAKKSRRR